MSIEEYIHAQRSNLQFFMKLPHFSILVQLVQRLYEHSKILIPKDSPPRYGRFFLLCHKSFLSAATLIGHGQPNDAAPITRRAIEISRVCLASKTNKDNEETWMAYEKRQARWKARQEGEKPRFLPPIKLDLPVSHPILRELETQLGILSDAYVHFTPEYYASQNWQDRLDIEPPVINLIYFITDQRTIKRELILLTGIHAKILQIIDECLDGAFSKDGDWRELIETLYREGERLGKEFKDD